MNSNNQNFNKPTKPQQQQQQQNIFTNQNEAMIQQSQSNVFTLPPPTQMNDAFKVENNLIPPQQQQMPIQYQQQQFQYQQQVPQQFQYQQAPQMQYQKFNQIQQQQQFNQAPIAFNQAPSPYPPQMNNIFGPNPHHTQIQAGKLRLLNNREEDKNKQVVAIIVTINSNGSYDHLFASVQQKSQQGTRVLVYEVSSTYIENLIKAYEGNPQDQVAKQMMVHIGKIHPDCVVFNWQCCGFYASQNFPEGKDHLFKFLKIIIDKGHMAMFSDFSLKALIKNWNQKVLGPNPFVKTGQTASPIAMRFNAGDLKECPSAQLQIVGQMAEGGLCNISTLPGTIVYSVNKNNLNHEFYKLKVLSVSTGIIPKQINHQCSIGQFKGSACHVLLIYPSGGMILTSMGHWIQLMKIDTSEKKLFEVAQKNFGKQYAVQMQNEYASLNVNQQQAWVSKNAVQFVQNQAPCSNMSKKSKNMY